MLNGLWIAQGAEFSGEPLPVPAARFLIDGATYRVEGENGSDEGVVHIDAAATPPAIDLTATAGVHAGRTIRAIFRRRGDLLQLCYEIGDTAVRPTVFATRGSMRVLVRYRRDALA
jgi:uncharacterized protein (TIGR03067 family)